MTRVLRATVRLENRLRTVQGRCALEPTLVYASDIELPAPEPIAETPSEPQPCVVDDELRQLYDTMERTVQFAEQARQQSLHEFQRLAVELSVAIASELAHRVIERDEFGVEGLVRAAISRLGLDSPLTISLHPTDVQLLEARAAAGAVDWNPGAIHIRPDSSLPRGHCRASNKTTMLLSELPARLEDIRDSLLEGLDDAQIERRQTPTAGQTLKRFPERRETA